MQWKDIQFLNGQDWSATWISKYSVHLSYTHKLQYTNYKAFNHVYLWGLWEFEYK